MTLAGFFVALLQLSSCFCTNPFYYFAPRMEGFGARYQQLRAVYDEVVTKRHRPLVLMGNVNDHHYGDLHDKEISMCDVLKLPPTVSCLVNKSYDIITTKKCQVPMCDPKQWHCQPFAYLPTPLIVNLAKKYSPETGNKMIELQKRMVQSWKEEDAIQFKHLAYTNETFKYIGVDMVKAMDFDTSECGLMFMYHFLLPFPEREKNSKFYETSFTSFSFTANALFKGIMEKLNHATNVNWYENVYVAHYRRGDKVEKCRSVESSSHWNCKDMMVFIKHMKEIVGGDKKLYIATNENDQSKLNMAYENTITGEFNSLNNQQLHLNSYELMIFEVQLMIHVKRVFFVQGASAMEGFVKDCRHARNYSRIEYLE